VTPIFPYKFNQFMIVLRMTFLMSNSLSPVLHYNLQTEFSCGTTESDRIRALISRRNCPLSPKLMCMHSE